MKIIDTDNFGGDYPDEREIATNITNQTFAEIMCAALNQKFCYDDCCSRYYKLQPGFEP